MDFWQAVRAGYRRCLTFQGRSSRPEFWYFVLYAFLGSVVCGRIDQALFGAWGPAPVSTLFLVVGGLPLIPAAWRRMHDTGRSGVFVLYPAIVMIGTTTFIGFLAGVAPSEPGETFGHLREAVSAIGGMIAAGAVFVLAISPLLVIWWLSRPSEPRANRWGRPVNSPALSPGETGRG